MSVHRRERADGDFARTISLTESVYADAARASYQDGMLVVIVPHAAEVKPRTITVS